MLVRISYECPKKRIYRFVSATPTAHILPIWVTQWATVQFILERNMPKTEELGYKIKKHQRLALALPYPYWWWIFLYGRSHADWNPSARKHTNFTPWENFQGACRSTPSRQRLKQWRVPVLDYTRRRKIWFRSGIGKFSYSLLKPSKLWCQPAHLYIGDRIVG